MDMNIGLAAAYERYNYHPIKFTKKSWIPSPIGMSYLRDAGNITSIRTASNAGASGARALEVIR